MRPAMLLLLLVGLAACTGDRGPEPPCLPPMYIDAPGNCVSFSPDFDKRV